MRQIEMLIDRIIDRVNVNLRGMDFDVGPFVRHVIPVVQFSKFYAFYGLTSQHPLRFYFRNSSLAGSYFLGKCEVNHSVLYKSDIRGDELKAKGQVMRSGGKAIPLHDDETIIIRDSFLNKTLVHSNSHDPEYPEEFVIRNTVSMPYANIHGAPTEGSFLGPFATVDLTTVHNSVIGTYAYVQAGEVAHERVEPGTIWINADGAFTFRYVHDLTTLERYISAVPNKCPAGEFMNFVESLQEEFEEAFATGHISVPVDVPEGASVSAYAVVRGNSYIGPNVLVAQRSYIQDSWMGKGANAQENCYIVNSRLEGFNVTAHGGKIIHARLGEKTFCGFNSFLRGSESAPLSIGEMSVVMPHTIIDLDEPVDIPGNRLVWGYIRNNEDLAKNSLPLPTLSRTEGEFSLGNMRFNGSGSAFLRAFQNRIEHILEENGAYFDGRRGVGHAQKGQNISFNIIQPYPEGLKKGLYPTIEILP